MVWRISRWLGSRTFYIVDGLLLAAAVIAAELDAASEQHDKSQPSNTKKRNDVWCLGHQIALHVVDTRKTDKFNELWFVVDEWNGSAEDTGDIFALDDGGGSGASAGKCDTQQHTQHNWLYVVH